jgi:hypothetical protein
MLRTFDYIVHHQPIFEVHLFVGTKPIGAEKLVIRAAINRECPVSVIEADQILFVYVIRRASVDPLGHVVSLPF